MKKNDDRQEKTYPIGMLAKMAGVSMRTLRYYDQIGLLCPKRADSGYRVYTSVEVDRLQQILMYRELEVPVDDIKKLLRGKAHNREEILLEQRERLLNRKEKIEVLLRTVDKTLSEARGEIEMSDAEKFDGFVKEQIDKNEQAYGAEVREKYGDKVMDESNAKMGKLSKKEFEALQEQGDVIYKELAACFTSGVDPASSEAQEVVSKHFAYLGNFGDFYTKEVYLNMGEMYAGDERFVAFYDEYATGLANWFKEAIESFCFES